MEYIRQLNPFYKMMSVAVFIFLISGIFSTFAKNGNNESVTAYSQKGSQGSEVEAVQQTLKDRGLFNAEVTGYFGEKTEEAILRFQKQQGLAQTGVADKATLKRLGRITQKGAAKQRPVTAITSHCIEISSRPRLFLIE